MKFPKHFTELVSLIKHSQYDALKAVNTELVNVYWQVGEYISRRVAAAEWGTKTVDELVAFIEKRHPDLKGFNKRGLYRMKQFFETYENAKFVDAIPAPILQIPEPVLTKKLHELFR